VYHSKWLTVAALTQTYVYIIKNGLKYSKLATKKADVFLQLKEDKPHTLYYYFAKPNIKAKAQSKVDILLCHTVIGQTLTFCLIVLDLKPRSQKWRNHALNTAYKAVINHKAILRQIPTKEKTLTPPPSVFHTQIHLVKRSPIMLRPRKSQKTRNSYGSADIIVHKDLQSLSGSSDKTLDVKTLSKPRVCTR
jgi:hypothetical protein